MSFGNSPVRRAKLPDGCRETKNQAEIENTHRSVDIYDLQTQMTPTRECLTAHPIIAIM
jgi:hypothetical protein